MLNDLSSVLSCHLGHMGNGLVHWDQCEGGWSNRYCLGKMRVTERLWCSKEDVYQVISRRLQSLGGRIRLRITVVV